MRRGFGLLDLLVGMALGLVVLGAITAAVGAGGRLLRNAAARGEGEDTTQMAVEASPFECDAGGTIDGAGRGELTEAVATGVALADDLDADGPSIRTRREDRITCRSGTTVPHHGRRPCR